MALMDELRQRGWLEEMPSFSDGRRVYLRLTEAGAAALSDRGVALPVAKPAKPIAFSCLDWTERRWHLGGALGRAIMDALTEGGCIERVPGSRVVELTGSLCSWLDS